jgi:hypothetical protein
LRLVLGCLAKTSKALNEFSFKAYSKAGSAFKLNVLGSKPRASKLEIALGSSNCAALKKSSYDPANPKHENEENTIKTIYFINLLKLNMRINSIH